MTLWKEAGYSLYIPTLPGLVAIDIRSGYIVILVCHVILQNHIIIWSCDFTSRGHLT